MSDKMRNLIVRTISGVVLLGIVLGAAYGGKFAFGAFLLLIVVVGMWEFYNIAAATGATPHRTLGLAAGIVLFVTSFFIFDGFVSEIRSADSVDMLIGGILYFSVLIPLCFVVELFYDSETPLRNVATTLMGIFYVAYPMALMLFIPILITGEWQPESFLFYLFIVWGNDVFAYLTGIAFGKHKMAPRISPKKSWEGFAGGVAGAMVMGAIGSFVVGGPLGMWLGLAAVVAITSVFGDLVESMFKREAGIKDSGKIMPGHGGVLDRFDALLISSPFAFVYLIGAHVLLENM
ncbi:MAG: phosphatidate cytidylyltransferase [Alistipes sp.]|nr:phosphatidate cytidylyltransferase [Alistipes sp.]